MFNPFSLQGKTILVTGASSGIGKQTAIDCSKMGASVIIVGRDKERLGETFNELQINEVPNIQCILDLTDEEAVVIFVNGLSKVDGISCNAGLGSVQPIPFLRSEVVKQVFNTNLFATIDLLRLMIKQKKLNRGASICLTSSVGGNKLFSPGTSVYGASKAALSSFTRTMAIELAGKAIRCNVVEPGRVNTKLINNVSYSQEDKDKDIEKYPLKRYAEPHEVSNVIIFLLSEASSFMTGQSLVVDGGRTLI